MFSYRIYKAHYRALWHLGFPIIVGQVGMIVLGFADTLMVGHHSTTELAAAGFVNSLFTLAILFSLGFSYGLTPLVGRNYGQNNKEEIGKLLRNSLFVNFLFALLVMLLLGIVYLNIDRLGQPEELLPLIRRYFFIQWLSIPFILCFNAFKQFSEGTTDTQTPMWILLATNVINIVGNYVLIYGYCGFPELGLVGAGCSTAFSRVMGVVIFVVLFNCAKRYSVYRAAFKNARLQRSTFRQLNVMGWPIAMQMGVETAAFSLSAVMVGWIGANALATHQICLTISQLCYMLYYGMGAAMAVRIAYFHGRNDLDSIRRTTNAGIHIILFMAVVTSLPLFILRNHLGGWFTSSDAVGEMVSAIVLIMILYQLGDGMQIAFANALRGLSDVKWNMIVALIVYIGISLPIGYLFAFICGWGLSGIWLAFPVSLSTAALGYYLRYRLLTKGTDSGRMCK